MKFTAKIASTLFLLIVAASSYATITGTVSLQIINSTSGVLRTDPDMSCSQVTLQPRDSGVIQCDEGQAIQLYYFDKPDEPIADHTATLEFNHYVVVDQYSYFMQAYNLGTNLTYSIQQTKGSPFILYGDKSTSVILSDDKALPGALDVLKSNEIRIVITQNS